MFFESFWLNFTVALALIISLTFDYVTKFFSYWYVRHIPYKSSIPFFGSDYHRVLGIRNNTDEVNTLYRQHPKADFVGSVKCRIPDLVVRNPDLIKEVLSTEFESFKSRGLDLDKSQDVCLRNNLFYVEGEKWTVLRRGLESLLSDVTLAEDCFLGNLSGTNGNINVQHVFSKVLDVVFKDILLKTEDEYVITELRTAFQNRSLKDKIFYYLKNIFPSVYVSIGLSTLFGQPSKKSTQTIEQSELMKKIASIFKDNSKQLRSNPKDLTFGILSSFISEGYIPCLNVLTALTYEIAKNPQIQKQARNSEEYLDAVIKETLRMYPPFSVITRKCVKVYKFPQMEGVVDKSVTMNVPVEAMHRDDTYFKEAEVFKPERFLYGAPVNGYAFLPFGAGPRKCIGEQISLQIVRSVAGALIKRFEIEPIESTPNKLPITDHNFGRVVSEDIWLRFKPINC